MQYLFLFFPLTVLAIGIFLVAKNYKSGLATPPVLSGIAFILLVLPGLLALVIL